MTMEGGTSASFIDLLKSPQATAAIVAGLVSLFVTIFGQVFNPIAQRRLERQKAELQKDLERQKAELQKDLEATKATLTRASSADSARREYEYEARKRLYAEIEPLLFGLYESIEGAYFRVISLARTSRSGQLGDGKKSWLAEEGYYLYSTAYKMLLPLAYYRLIQRRMTFIDLKLDEEIRVKYGLLKMLYYSFTDDFDFAKIEPKIEYHPNHANWRALSRENPGVYLRQALVIGEADSVIDALIVRDPDGVLRPLTYGEFEKILEDETASAHETLGWSSALYRGFAPQQRPVLARMLIAQAFICDLLFKTYRGVTSTEKLQKCLGVFLATDRDKFLWQSEEEPVEFEIATRYVRERLRWLD